MTAKISAAPTITTLTIDSEGTTKEFEFFPLTDRELDQLNEWLQTRFIGIARRSLTPDTPQVERDEMLRIAMLEAINITYMTRDGIRILATLSGVAYLGYLSMRKNPNVTAEWLQSILHFGSNLNEVNSCFTKANMDYFKKNTSSKAESNGKKSKAR